MIRMLKMKIAVVVPLFLILITPLAMAYEVNPSERAENIEQTLELLDNGDPQIKREYSVPRQQMPVKEHSFEVGTEASYIKYEEPGVMRETGMMFGINGVYNFRPQENALAGYVDVYHIDGHLNYGQVDYTGTGKIDNIDDYMMETRLWIGKDIGLGQSRLTPYVGLGYRWLYDDLGVRFSSTNAAGYDRQSQYFYLPAGLEFNIETAQGWQIGLVGEYDLFIRGRQTSYLSDLGGPDIKNTQKKGYGLRGAINIVKKTEAMNFVFGPYIRYWNIQKSNVVTATANGITIVGAYEPKNTSTEIGGKIGVEF